MLIEITGRLLNADHVSWVEPDETWPGKTKILLVSGDWLTIPLPYDEVKAALLNPTNPS